MNEVTKNEIRLPAHVKPERYKIMLRPDLNEFTFSGEETIDLILEKPAKQIILHSVDLEVESPDADKITYDKKTETVTLTFKKLIQKGKHQLKLQFMGILNDKMRGFYRSKYEHEGKEKYLATTQFEATDARRAFPCFDEPSHKAIFDVTLMVPAETTAISNTIESNILEHESGYQIVEFAPTPKMSTYLLAFIVGEFEYIEAPLRQGSAGRGKRLVRVFTTPGKKKQAEFALDVAVKCLDFYEDYFGIEYPLPVLDMIAIPDFAAGAMENWGAVTYRESTLLIDEAHSSSANKQWVALIIAHELAHQWFGNLVTMEWWTHLWLNEGFASFIEYLAIDHIFPEWDIWTQFVATEMSDAFSLDSLKNTHPIEVKVGHPAEISEIFDKVSYSKGASVLRMLWKYLGEGDFQKGLQHYLKKHAYSNASTEDLWMSLEEVSGKPVAKVMRNWTARGGHPVIRVQATGNRLQLTQSRFFSSPISKKESEDRTIWSIPLDKLLMDKKSMTIPNREEKLNIGETALARVAYPQDYLHGKFNAPDRLGLIRDTFDLVQAGEYPTTRALEFVLTYVEEKDYTVWAEITSRLAQLDSLLAYESFYPSFQDYGRKIYAGIVKKMGWKKKAHEKHTDALMRGMVLNMLGGFGDKETIKKAQELFSYRHSERLVRNPPRSWKIATLPSVARNDDKYKIDPDLKSVVYNLVAENGGKEEFETLLKMYKEEDNHQEKDRIGRALGKFKSKTLLTQTLNFSITEYVRYQSVLQIIAAVWHNPTGRYLTWEFAKANWKLLKDRYAGGHYFTKVFGSAGEFTKVSDAKDIERFTRKNPVPEAKRTIAQALEQIYSNAEWLKRDREKIKNFLKNPGVSTRGHP